MRGISGDPASSTPQENLTPHGNAINAADGSGVAHQTNRKPIAAHALPGGSRPVVSIENHSQQTQRNSSCTKGGGELILPLTSCQGLPAFRPGISILRRRAMPPPPGGPGCTIVIGFPTAARWGLPSCGFAILRRPST